MEVAIGVHTRPGSASSAPDPDTARFSSIVDLLMSVGHVDGEFDQRSRAFVLHYVDSIVLMREQSSMEPADVRARLSASWRAHFAELDKDLGDELAQLAQAPDRLRSRVLALFSGLPWNDQATALELIHGLLHSDGSFTATELALYEELMAAFVVVSAAPSTTTAKKAGPAPMIVGATEWKPLAAVSHPLLDPLEQTYSPHPDERKAQIEWDYHLIQQAMMQWHNQRAAGANRLAGIQNIEQLPVGSRFLDGFVHAFRPSAPVELIVLGDLHGCYSCLKAALLQSNFIERAWAHQWDPQRYPDVKLVFLGDYIDRGRFSFDGVLRAALQLFVAMPDQVILLRGNHEWLKWQGDRIVSGVYPAEALASIVPHVPVEMLEAYRQLFELMPTSMLCEQTLLVHAGIPRADTFEARYHGLSSLNDPELRFQMMWSDPAQCDRVVVETQRQNPRFSFGRAQFREFMERAGMTTMIRGHEQIDRGFDVFYDLGDQLLLTVFSAGGSVNADLPPESSYRAVTPMALTLQYGNGTPTATPWMIDYAPFNFAPHNGLYRAQPVLEFRYA
ncbi:MAG: serine/threonine protein phosphatase [Deltaproteobacteria bacterium]|nr:serine/threonine protein phosphatase [Deltaproteobacteria bacterium]